MSKTIAIRPVAAPAADAVQLTDEERQPCEVWTRVMGYHRPIWYRPLEAPPADSRSQLTDRKSVV